MLLGAHMSISGGVDLAIDRGAQIGCSAIQIFTKNNNQWVAPEIPDIKISSFFEKKEATGIQCVFAHDSYLINLGSPSEKLIASNRKAARDYHLTDKYEAGIVLSGTEVKSLRNKGGNLSDSFARVEKEQVILYHFHISPYKFGNRENPDPVRSRKLLLHKKEIKKLIGLSKMKGYVLVPTKVYFKGSLVKIELALGKGKESRDKRQDIKKKEHDREMQKALKYRHRR